MKAASALRLSASRVRSLAWEDGDLVDWVDGGRRHLLDGSTIESYVRWGFAFDSALTLPESGYAVIYTRLGTKGLVLKGGRILREINRSYYHAEVYEYPIALGRLPSGREVLVHCPNDYCRLEIEDLATGQVLTNAVQRTPGDFFHSRLSVSTDGRFLISAGWVWHPIDQVQIYDLEAALADPRQLDGCGIDLKAWADSSSATFLADGRVAIWLMGDIDDEDTPTKPGELRIIEPLRPADTTIVSSVGCLGTILAVDDHVLALHDHPRLIELKTGIVVRSWPDVRSGRQTSSILLSNEIPPPVALDAANRRCAIADDTGITVIRW
ncbi:hypothetical protein [Ideonella sp.]|uniref:hypothetical protein n=1 Tax=Ideonella sp. TaxID=1929293 RepID=UPI0035B363D2